MYPETVAVLRKFMDRYGSFLEIIGITSSFSRSAAFRPLGLVLHRIELCSSWISLIIGCFVGRTQFVRP
ncbi:unnamed protein product [Prunus brigantina]